MVGSLLKRWLTGTLHYAVSQEHLAYFLDEYTFRFNRCTSNSRGLLFYRLLEQAVNTDPHLEAISSGPGRSISTGVTVAWPTTPAGWSSRQRPIRSPGTA